MSIRRGGSSILMGAVLLFCGAAAAQERPADVVTQQLFEQYIARQAKIGAESVQAATHPVAERGRESGFWKTVLAELQRDNPHSELGCVRVLGKMLAIDAAARDAIRRQKETGEISAWIPSVCLGPEVVTELLARAPKADRFRIDHYTIALARARTPAARDFFKAILHAAPARPVAAGETAPTGPYHLDSTRFHAAVGLAQLSDAGGLDWLIEHCEFHEGTVMNAWPRGARSGGDLNACCCEALRHLSGEHARTSQAEWKEWSRSVDKKVLLDHAVAFGDP